MRTLINIIRNLYGNKTVSWSTIKAAWRFERKRKTQERRD